MELLERESELAVLAGAVERAAAGRGGAVLVGGEAGIRKSALVRAFCAALPVGVRVLTGACNGSASSGEASAGELAGRCRAGG